MTAALDLVKTKPGVEGRRLGIWGVDVGAFSALRAAASSSEVVAIAADSPFGGVRDFVRVRLREDLGIRPGRLEDVLSGLFSRDLGFTGGTDDRALDLAALADRRVLLIHGGNRPWAAGFVADLAKGLGPGSEVAALPAARVRLLTGRNLVEYDRRVTAFFQSSLKRPGDSRGLTR